MSANLVESRMYQPLTLRELVDAVGSLHQMRNGDKLSEQQALLLLLQRGLDVRSRGRSVWELETSAENEAAFGQAFLDLLRRGARASVEQSRVASKGCR